MISILLISIIFYTYLANIVFCATWTLSLFLLLLVWFRKMTSRMWLVNGEDSKQSIVSAAV